MPKVHATLVEKTRKQPADYLAERCLKKRVAGVQALSFLSDNAEDLRRG